MKRETLRDKFAGAFLSTHEPDDGFATIDETDVDHFLTALVYIAEEDGAKEYAQGLRAGKIEVLEQLLQPGGYSDGDGIREEMRDRLAELKKEAEDGA